MAINQFAKISPIINREGYLYNLDSDGNVKNESDISDIRLKTNEIGIIYKEDALATMSNGKLVRIGGVSAYDETNIDELLINNDNNELDGKLIVYKNGDQYQLVIIKGKTLVLPESNTTRTLKVCLKDGFENIGDLFINNYSFNLHKMTFIMDDDTEFQKYVQNYYEYDPDELVFIISYYPDVMTDVHIDASTFEYHKINYDNGNEYPILFTEEFGNQPELSKGMFAVDVGVGSRNVGGSHRIITSNILNKYPNALDNAYLTLEYSLYTDVIYTMSE